MNMENNEATRPIMETSLKDLFIKALYQWKIAVVMVIVFSLLMPLLKYSKEMRSYNAQMNSQSASTEMQEGTSVEEQIAGVLAQLDSSERSKVEQLIEQDKWMREREEYYRNSAFSHVDLYDCNSVHFGYRISGLSNPDATASIQRGYAALFDSDDNLVKVRDVLNVDVEPQFIKDLIDVDAPVYVQSNNISYDQSDNDGMIGVTDGVVDIVITYPQDTDTELLKDTITALVQERKNELSSVIEPHDITLIYTEKSDNADNSVIGKQQELFSWNYNFQAWNFNMKAWLNDRQKAAYEQISRIISLDNDQINNAAEPQTIEKPSINKKYVILGAAMGIVMFILLCAIQLLSNKCIYSPENAKNITNANLLGEIYYETPVEGFKKVAYSKKVGSFLHRGIPDLRTQTEKIAKRIRLQLERKGMNGGQVLFLANNSNISTVIQNIINSDLLKDATVTSMEIDDAFDEGNLLDAQSTFITVCNKDKVADVQSVVDMCDALDIAINGVIFVEE